MGVHCTVHFKHNNDEKSGKGKVRECKGKGRGGARKGGVGKGKWKLTYLLQKYRILDFFTCVYSQYVFWD